MKRTPEGILRHKEIILAMGAAAFDQVKRIHPDKVTEDNAYRILSTLRTHVKCVRRGAVITYTLVVPEINQTFIRKEPTALEFEGE